VTSLIILCAVADGAEHFKVDDLLKIRMVSDPQLSPDGRWIAYTITDTYKANNRRATQIYLVPAEGGEPRQITNEKSSSYLPRWSPDGKRLAFISARDGASQIWTIEMAGGNLKKVSNISTGADGALWSPDGKWIAFLSNVYPDCKSDECNKMRDHQVSQSKVRAKIAGNLLYRHGSWWDDGTRTHIFIIPSDGGEARDLTPGEYDAPANTGSGFNDYSFSPDSKELAFARNTDREQATSTNSDIFTVSLIGGEPKRITGANRAGDHSPLYSPDGRYIAYRAQRRAGFEADRWQLMLYDLQTHKSSALTRNFDSSVEGFKFSPASDEIYLTAAERGRKPVYRVSLKSRSLTKIIAGSFNEELQISDDGKIIIFSRQSVDRPPEVFRANSDGSAVVQITRTNDDSLAAFHLMPAEDINWIGASGTPVHGFIIKPPDFTPTKKWPLLVLIHGGPQIASSDSWNSRWSPQVFASAGYVVFTPNPRGSKGYGQKFIDEVSRDWGGKVFTDILNGVDQVASLPYIDREKIAAAGGSFGGYMVNWIEGHNDHPRVKFKTLVSHAGVYNLTSSYGSTDELWFFEWEFKGTPWTNPAIYAKWSPHAHAMNFKTPMLITHGGIDYRVPATEGLQMFTTLQRQGIESRLLYFPDEGHSIQRPLNIETWYDSIIQWLDAHLNPALVPGNR
jgi:dipeptidyl aminopeptidase/acylaminoacyl peptidase